MTGYPRSPSSTGYGPITLKTSGALRIEQATPGTYDVRTPSGHVYHRHPDGTTTPRKRDPAPDTDTPAY